MNKLEEYLLMGAIVIFAVLLYLFMPELITFVASHSKGIWTLFSWLNQSDFDYRILSI